MKVIPVYLLSVENGACKLLWATMLVGAYNILAVVKILEQANSRGDFNLSSSVHHGVIQETKDNVKYIIDACGLPAPGETTKKIVAGTRIGQVKINKVKGWLCS